MLIDKCNVVLVKTVLDMENITASYIEELDPNSRILVAPYGLKGLIIVEASKNKYELAKEIEEKIPEAERVLVAEACVRADLQEMARIAAEVAKKHIKSHETFAVRTVRRGHHSFTSIDANVVVGDAVRKATSASVNLRYPDKVVAVEIVHDKAYICIYPGNKEWKKMRPGKYPLYKVFRRFAVVQMPYLGPLDACRTMGVRIGREVQNFEVRELIIAPMGAINALQLKTFLDGVFEGIESRYEVQRKSYGRDVHKVKVYVQDLYQLVRDRRNETIIVFEPEGEHISRVVDRLYELISRPRSRINLFFGSREGIPQGIYRFAELVLDIAPGITLSTEYAAAAALIAIGTILHNRLTEEKEV